MVHDPTAPASRFEFLDPASATRALLERLSPIGGETVLLAEARGRVLAVPVIADRPSPPCDVSAMDGYVVRLADLSDGELEVAGEVRTGSAPPELPPGSALRIFTGGAVPDAGEAVIPREVLIEEPGRVRFKGELDVRAGQHIRRRGENLRTGEEVVPAGRVVGPEIASALATFGAAEVEVGRRIRAAIVVTGDELVGAGERPDDARIRDSNGPALEALLGGHRWIDVASRTRQVDDLAGITATIRDRYDDSDAILLTGGVSMGDHDLVEAALTETGAEVVFHWLPIRPGKPILAALGPGGQLILGLPGNPVSAMVTARRFGLPALRKIAGFAEPEPAPEVVEIRDPDSKTLHLHWHRLVSRTGPGTVELVGSRGSGDPAALARSDGFVCAGPGELTEGRLPFWSWTS